MDTLIDAIRAAVAADATDDARQAGAAACRTILTALEATAGAPLVAPAVASVPTAPAASPIATVLAAMRTIPSDQLLDLVIDKLRATATARGVAPTAAPVSRSGVQFQIVPVSRPTMTGGPS
jgi:hypothetical protein